MAQVTVGSTIRVKVVFRDWTDEDEDGPRIDPDTVDVEVHSDNMTPIIETGTATRSPSDTSLEVDYYYYDWTAESEGSFTIRFIGTIIEESTEDTVIVVEEDIEVGAPFTLTDSLIEDQELFFAGEITPLFVDPEEILIHHPDATALLAAEHIARHSLEVKKILKLDDTEEPPFIALEYVRAAAICALNRIFDYGLGGDTNSLSLGDLSVSNQTYPRTNINRANAMNWCEIAATLRREMIQTQARMKPVSKGASFDSPMPKRGLRRAIDKR